MFYKGYITYKNKASNSFSGFKLIMTAPPEYVHSEIKQDIFDVPYRNGALYGKNTYRGDATIKVSFDIVTTGSASNYTAALNDIYLWLKGTGNLIISDESAYYEVKKVVITTDQRTIVNYGKIDVEFVVYPYKFLIETYPSTSDLSIKNDHDDCYPLYFLQRGSTGSEATFTITVNNNSFSVECPSDASAVYVDTRKKMSYYETAGDHKVEVVASGDYEKLILPGGGFTSVLTKSGFSTLNTTYRWGYEI